MFFQHEPSCATPSAMRYHLCRWFTALLAFLLLVNFPTPIALAAALTVNSLADVDNGSDSVCTLREAIIAANNDANYNECASVAYGNDTITFSVSGTITLGSSLPTITAAAGLTIDGGNAVTISGNNAVRVLDVSRGAVLTLQNLTIADGNADLLSGALNNFGTLIVNNGTFSGNRGSFGGGLNVTSDGAATISNSTFSGNSASNAGGAISSTGALTITASTILSNTSDTGGGISNFGGSMTVSNSSFSGNSGSMFAGGILNASGVMTISNSAISANSANSGGGLYNGSGGAVTIGASTFSGNSASRNFGGGLYNNGGIMAVSNSTLSGNNASDGGGVLNALDGAVSIGSSTLSNNSATTGGGINNFSGTMTVTNSIVANSPLGGNCAGTITNGGHNLESFTTCGWGSSNGSLSSTDPKLGPLANNGGPTQTHALLTGSPAINAGNNSLILADVTDQDGDGNTSEPLPFDQRGRGFLRVIKGTLDIGAFEAGAQVHLPMIVR